MKKIKKVDTYEYKVKLLVRNDDRLHQFQRMILQNIIAIMEYIERIYII